MLVRSGELDQSGGDPLGPHATARVVTAVPGRCPDGDSTVVRGMDLIRVVGGRQPPFSLCSTSRDRRRWPCSLWVFVWRRTTPGFRDCATNNSRVCERVERGLATSEALRLPVPLCFADKAVQPAELQRSLARWYPHDEKFAMAASARHR